MSIPRKTRRTGAAIAAATAASLLGPTVASAAPTNGNLALNPAKHDAPARSIAQAMSYKTVSGDSLTSISQRTGVSAATIAAANNLGANSVLRVGQMLRIPVPTVLAPTPKAPLPTTVTVRSGDTLSGIAYRHDTTVRHLADINDLANPNLIHVGQVLKLRTATSAPVTAAPKPAAKPAAAPKATVTKTTPKATTTVKKAVTATGGVYTVVSGDTLSAIAYRNGTTVAALASLNDISNPAFIRVGQKIKLTGTAAPTTKDATAPKPATTTTKAAAPKPAATKATPAKTVPAAGAVYVVKAGDSLYKIALAYNSSVSAIAKANGIANPARIGVGQRLTIPGASSSTAAAPAETKAATTKAATTQRETLVKNDFPGYTYPDATVAAANENAWALRENASLSKAEVQAEIKRVAAEMGVDPRLALAHAFVESGFNAKVVSPANAIGTMQVIPSSGVWASGLVGRDLDLLNPYDNIAAGVAIIKSLQNSADSLEQGIAGYYQGLGGVRKYGMRPDTKNYVAKVKAAMNRF